MCIKLNLIRLFQIYRYFTGGNFRELISIYDWMILIIAKSLYDKRAPRDLVFLTRFVGVFVCEAACVDRG